MKDWKRLAKVTLIKFTFYKGSFGSVYKIRRKSDNLELVWKELDYGRMSDREKQQLIQEVNIIS